MNKCVAIRLALPVKNTSAFSSWKAAVEIRMLGHALDPEHALNLEHLRDVLLMTDRGAIREAVSVYMTSSISKRADATRIFFDRMCLFFRFLDNTLTDKAEQMVVKIRFFKEAWGRIKEYRYVSFPSPTGLGLCFGFVSRGRDRDDESGRSRAVVLIHQGRLVLTNNLLGRGVFGSVKTGRLHRPNGAVEIVAVKRIRLAGDWKTAYPALLAALQEVCISRILGPHPNIMPVYDYYVYDDGKKKKNPDSKERPEGLDSKFAVVMPKALRTGLSILSKDIRLKQAFSNLFEASLALSHIEAMGYVHNDFKLDNLLVFEDGTVKLGDFGMSYAPGEEPRNHTLGGTYPSPEAVESRISKYEGVDFSKIDTFSFGVILFDVLFYKADQKWVLKDIPKHKWAHYQPDLKNGYLHDRESYDHVLNKWTLVPANPVLGFISMARTYCEDLQSRFKSAKNRFVPELADLVLCCLASDPKARLSMRDVVRRMMAIQKWVETT